MATLAPSAAKRFATAAPIPRDPPVTSATLPSSFLDIIFSLFPRMVTYVRCVKALRRYREPFWLFERLSALYGRRDEWLGVADAGRFDDGVDRVGGDIFESFDFAVGPADFDRVDFCRFAQAKMESEIAL